MAITVYPDTNYNSFISESAANDYAAGHIDGSAFTALADPEPTILTAFRDISALDLEILTTDATQLQALKDAQAEQAVHLAREPEKQLYQVAATMGTKIRYKYNETFSDLNKQYSQRVLDILRPYMSVSTVSLSR